MRSSTPEAATTPITEYDSVDYWLSTLGDAQPTFTTLPTPGAKNELAKCEKMAVALGTPLLAWQRFFLRVATELNDDGSYRYPTVILTVPRQSGKTTVVRTLLAARSLSYPMKKSYLTCQTGRDARERWAELNEQIARSVFGKTVHIRRAADSPKTTFHNGSFIAPFAPSADSLHGYNFSWGVIDEAFSFDEIQGNDLLGAMTPAMQTHKDRQLILVSTKGTPKSTFLNSFLKRGKLSLQDDETGICFMEWSLAEGIDASDPAYWNFHPGIQGNLISKDDIAAAQNVLSKGEFERAMMNRQTSTFESVLDTKKWAQSYAQLATPKRSNIAIGWELAFDKSSAAVVAAWKEGDYIQLKVIRTGSGVSWLPGTLQQIKDSRPLDMAGDKVPMNQMIADAYFADNYGQELRLLKADEFKTASVTFKTLLEDGRLQHDGHAVLKDAISTAATRRLGEHWVFSHTESEPALLAAVAAVRMVTEQRQYEKPEILVFE